ncbi:MAG: acireductone synthase [Synechococcus sp.]
MSTSHLLLDIEGTTCPITFVSKVLFPYAQAQLGGYLNAHHDEDEVKKLIQNAWHEWRTDHDPTSQKLLQLQATKNKDHDHDAIANYLLHLIELDRKSTTLKDLQGRIWKQGYASGAIQSELYPEALNALKSWHAAGYKLAVYSSGSVTAQQLLYEHTADGDVRHLFDNWFDTHTGPKKSSSSYSAIAEKLRTPPHHITFISDNRAECDAAEAANLQTLFSLREGNPDQSPGHHRVIESLDQVLDAIQTRT